MSGRILLRPQRAAAALAVAAALACGGPAGPARRPPALELLDALCLAPVADPDGAPLLAGRWEVTRGELDPDCAAEERDLPAILLDRREAAAWASARGLRLPTLAEWQRLAGPARPGARPRTETANTLELDLRAPVPVGVFERGRSADGLYDLIGNVWEWVADDVDGGFGLPPHALACGGSWASAHLLGGAGPAATRLLEAGERAEDLGFRVVGDPVPWLEERIQPLWRGGAWQPELRAIFQGWRAAPRAELARLLRAHGLDPGLCAAVEDPGR